MAAVSEAQTSVVVRTPKAKTSSKIVYRVSRWPLNLLMAGYLAWRLRRQQVIKRERVALGFPVELEKKPAPEASVEQKS